MPPLIIVGIFEDRDLAKQVTYIAKCLVVGQRAQELSRDFKKRQATEAKEVIK